MSVQIVQQCRSKLRADNENRVKPEIFIQSGLYAVTSRDCAIATSMSHGHRLSTHTLTVAQAVVKTGAVYISIFYGKW